jgi:hypothetical protein
MFCVLAPIAAPRAVLPQVSSCVGVDAGNGVVRSDRPNSAKEAPGRPGYERGRRVRPGGSGAGSERGRWDQLPPGARSRGAQWRSTAPVIDRTYPLSEISEGIGYLERGHARGKIVITV